MMEKGRKVIEMNMGMVTSECSEMTWQEEGT